MSNDWGSQINDEVDNVKLQKSREHPKHDTPKRKWDNAPRQLSVIGKLGGDQNAIMMCRNMSNREDNWNKCTASTEQQARPALVSHDM